MNNITTIHNIKEERAGRSMTDDLQRLWLISALRDGMESIERDGLILADDAYFAKLEGIVAKYRDKAMAKGSAVNA